VPKLRFPEFNIEWEKKKLGDIVDFYKGKGISREDLSDNGTPCILYGELYTTYGEIIDNVVSKTNLDIDFFMSKANDIIIPSSGETAEDISCASAVLLDNIALGGDLNVLRPKENIDGSFLSFALNFAKKYDIAKVAQGASIVHVYADSLKQLYINVPSLQEQQKITNFLSTINSRIKTQEKKIENIEEMKKGFMQKIFSQEIRFKDKNGEEYPEWEEKKLENIVELITSNLSIANALSNGQYLLYDANGIIGKTDKKVGLQYISIIKDGAGVGRLRLLEEDTYFIGTMNGFISYTENIKFLYYFLNQMDFKKYVVGSGIPHIYFKDYKTEKFRIPILEEQEKIANFLSLFDEKIETEKKILEVLQEIKKGLLQQMFV
jgi:type I restriction enzyme S subunit